MSNAQSFPPLTLCSIPRRYRLGVPSYVYPADILPNVEALAPYVDDVELLLLESGSPDDRRQTTDGRPCGTPEVSDSNIPAPDTIVRLAELAQQHDLTYTVHFPIDRHLGSPDAGERHALLRQMLAIMESTRPLRPYAYILHLEGVTRESDRARVQTWQNDITGLLPALIECAGDPTLLCVENLNYPFAWCEGLLDRFGLGICIDLGHLLVGGDDVDTHLQRHLPRTRVIHLHGVRDGHDHLALTALPPGRLRQLMNSIDKFTGVLTLEIFNYEEVRDSVVSLNQLS
jgi:sugar phosphate isomerase/epimerase